MIRYNYRKSDKSETSKRRLIDQIGDSPTFVAEGSLLTGDLETPGPLVMCGIVRGDGRVEGAKILSVSGVPPFDFAALQAILTSSPFRPLPKDLGSDKEGVNVTFFYNIRPGKEEQAGGKK